MAHEPTIEEIEVATAIAAKLALSDPAYRPIFAAMKGYFEEAKSKEAQDKLLDFDLEAWAA